MMNNRNSPNLYISARSVSAVLLDKLSNWKQPRVEVPCGIMASARPLLCAVLLANGS